MVQKGRKRYFNPVRAHYKQLEILDMSHFDLFWSYDYLPPKARGGEGEKRRFL